MGGFDNILEDLKSQGGRGIRHRETGRLSVAANISA